MKRAFYLTLNEVRLYLRDRGDLAFSLLLPIVTFALIYGAFGGQTMFTATARIVDEDGGPYAAALIQKIDEVKGTGIELLTAEQASRKLERSDVLLVVHIPEGFSQKLSGGEQAELIFRQRGNGGQEGQILASIARSAIEDQNWDFIVRAGVAGNVPGVPAEHIKLEVEKVLAEEMKHPALEVKEELVGGSAEIVNLYLPGIVTMYVLFTVTLSARAIVKERHKGTLKGC